jgi:hypothetical protein
VIYLDTSVVLAQLLAEDRQPPETLWAQPLLDALHLASLEFLRQRDRGLTLASYDERLVAAGRALGIPIAEL